MLEVVSVAYPTLKSFPLSIRYELVMFQPIHIVRLDERSLKMKK
ncbi:hypothetical protein [uncultured Nostoc sp.]